MKAKAIRLPMWLTHLLLRLPGWRVISTAPSGDSYYWWIDENWEVHEEIVKASKS